MQATRIIAIRHGETAWNVDTRLQGHLDIGLNDRGRWQASRAALALQGETLDTIYASDLSRARDTAQAVASLSGQTVHTTPGLRERHFGLLQGQTHAEIEANWPVDALLWRQRDPHWVPEGGESLVVFYARVVETLAELAAQHVGQQIVLVAHGGVLDMLYRAATGQGLQAPRSWNLGNATINRLLWTPDALTLVGWADSRHLDEAEMLDETST
jgi:probable phosphoglycerate mutase